MLLQAEAVLDAAKECALDGKRKKVRFIKLPFDIFFTNFIGESA